MRDERKLVPSASAAGVGLTDRNGTPHPLDVLQVINGRLLVGFVAEIHKSETPFAARLPIKGQGALAHLAVLAEQVNQILPLSVPGEVSNKDRQKKTGSRPFTFAHKLTRAVQRGSATALDAEVEIHRRPFIRAKLS